MENKEIVIRIKTLMEVRGENANMFAKAIKFNQSNFSKVLKGDRNVPANLIKAICDELGVSYQWLTEGVGGMFVGNNITITGTANNNSGGTNIGAISGNVINGTDPERQERRDIAQEGHENDLLRTINSLIAIKTKQGMQEQQLLNEIQQLRDALKEIISTDGRYKQMLEVNMQLQDMNAKLLSIVEKMTDK